MERNWSIGDPAWCWPDTVDETGTDTACGSRYLPVQQTRADGYSWTVCKVFVDEDDPEMLDDARLIAAAPEMLRVLNILNNRWDEYDEDADPHIGEMLRRVLAQAEGREAK